MVTVWFGVGQFFPGDLRSIISRRWQFPPLVVIKARISLSVQA